LFAAASATSAPDALVPLDAALVAELGGSRGTADALLRRLEGEILAEVASFPAEKLPKKRVASQAMFVRVPALVGDSADGRQVRSDGWRPPPWRGWSVGSTTLALRLMLMTANALAVATTLSRQLKRGGLLVLLPRTEEDEDVLPAAVSALWREAPFAVGGWQELDELGSMAVQPGAVLLFSLFAQPGAAVTPPERVLAGVETLRRSGVPFVLCTLFLDEDAASSRQAAEAAVRALLAQLQPPPEPASSPRTTAAQLSEAAAAPACDGVRLTALLASAEAALQGLTNTETSEALRCALREGRARLEAARLEAALREALGGRTPDEALLRSALDATRQFAAASPPLTRAAAAALNALADRVAGRCEALSQVAAARAQLSAALLPQAHKPEDVRPEWLDALQAALDASATCAWPWQLVAEVRAAQAVQRRWLALRRLSEAVELSLLSDALRCVVVSYPDVDVSTQSRVLAGLEASAALEGGDSRLGAYRSAVTAAWQDGELGTGGAAILAGLRQSLFITPVEHETVLRVSGVFQVQALPPGAERQVGGIRYNQDDVIGTGSRGTYVLRGSVARTSRARHACAVKRIVRAPGEAGRRGLQLVEREVELLSALKSSFVVDFMEWGVTDEAFFLAIELCAESLEQAVCRQPQMALDERLRLCREAVAAVAWLHGQGVAHNDLRPANILLSLAGGVKLADLGLAVRLGEDQVEQEVPGDFSLSTFVQYGVELNLRGRPPEVLAGSRLTSAVDVFSLGCVLFFILTGGGAAFSSDANIRGGRFDLTGLMSGLRPRSALEARHLIAGMLVVEPAARPTAAVVLRHPLFWTAGQVVRAAKELHASGVDVELQLGEVGERGALIMAAACDTQGWQSRVEGGLLERMRQMGSAYEDDFPGLLRFIRNVLEHPPTAAESREVARNLDRESPGKSVGERKELFADWMVSCFPTLGIAVYECGGQAVLQEGERRGRRKAKEAPAAAPSLL